MKIHKSTHRGQDIDIVLERAKKSIVSINGVEADDDGTVNIETGSVPYIGTTLPPVSEASELTDYYIKTEGTNYYTHYRFINGEFEPISSGGGSGGNTGGGTGSGTSVVLIANTPTTINISPSEKFVISVSYISKDSSGNNIPGTYTWKLGSTIIKQGSLNETNIFDDLHEKISGTGTKYLVLTATNIFGDQSTPLYFSVNVVDLKLEVDFNDTIRYDVGKEISFSYRPIGTIDKTVYIKLDGKKVFSEEISKSVSGTRKSYTIPPQNHGSHVIECYLTASIGDDDVESEHIYKNIICFDKDSNIPVIGSIYNNNYYGHVDTDQYNTKVLPFVVYSNYNGDLNSNVDITINGETTHETITNNQGSVIYRANNEGIHDIIISCGNATPIIIKMNVKKLDIDIEPITDNLAFDFNPVGYSNTSQNKLWNDSKNKDIKLSVSDNFDWYNGGYVLDNEGNACFCVKSGTRATINYSLFSMENDPATYGASFKCIFKTTNVKQAKAQFLNCTSPDQHIGLEMNVHEAYIRNSVSELYIPYSEEDIIEFDYTIDNINNANSKGYAIVMSYEDGAPLRPMQYNDGAKFYQTLDNTTYITIGSDDCDTYIYRMKAYTIALDADDVLNNFIADARNASDMIDRSNRNKIFDNDGNITPDSVYDACPDLKIVMIDCRSRFTTDKDLPEKCDIQIRHKNGRSVEDNWSAINCYHTGQGTSSNSYGYSGRNIDIALCFDGEYKMKKTTFEADYITELTMGDGTVINDGTGKITLTENSIPNAYFNIKVNIASSENANNALLAKRFNDYLPYQSIANLRDNRIKNTMEFVNCVIFIRENDPDINVHSEFNDNLWHFYGLGNIGDSKKTDNTRVNDPNDVNEFVVEISDWDRPNSCFDTGVYKNNIENPANMIYPISKSQWNSSNSKYNDLHNNWFKDAEDNGNGKKGTYEFRYEHPDADDAQIAKNIRKWNEFYEWVITSTDKEFVDEFNHWFVEDSALYYYLFTERFTMVDNRAKNTFWHYSKVYSVPQFTGDNGYRFDFWDYDNDTSFGINNSGELTMPYGMEDTDILDSGEYVFRAAHSVFFRRISTLMKNKLNNIYNSVDNKAWDSHDTITEFDNWQNQFPEALWIADMKRKYKRTFTGESYDNSKPGAADDQYLIKRFNGRKKYQRRQFERDHDMFIATKYISSKIISDQIYMRCSEKTPESIIEPDYTLYVVPYQDMYVTIANGDAVTQKKAKAGEMCKFENDSATADIIKIYASSKIQAINDLSKFYLREANFPNAKKLKTLIIGSNATGYIQKTLNAINLGDNPILEKLDITNCAGLDQSPAIYGCKELREFYAGGTTIKSVNFAPNGKIETAILPDTVNTLYMEKLMYLDNLDFSFNNIDRLTIDNCNIDTLHIINDTIDTLSELTLSGIDWVVSDTTLINQLLPKSYGGKLDISSLSGNINITGAIREQELIKYANTWPDLTIKYNSLNIVPQYLVKYVNADINRTELWSTYVDVDGFAPDPYDNGNGPIEKPVLDSDEQYNYEFSHWDDITKPIYADTTIVAAYNKSIRSYTVKWFNQIGEDPLETVTVEYGKPAIFSKPLPTVATDIHLYKVFTGWDKSTGFIKADTDVYAEWDIKTVPLDGTELKDMSPAEIYAVFKSGRASEFVSEKDYVDITLGHDFNFKNVDSEIITTNKYFDGNTILDTDHKLFGAYEKSFTIAIDLRFMEAEKADATILSCINNNSNNGFCIKLKENAINVHWGNSVFSVSYKGYRDMIVLRHVKNTDTLTVYTSTAHNSATPSYSKNFTLDSMFEAAEPRRMVLRSTLPIDSESPLTLGAIPYPDGTYGPKAKGIVYWCKIWFDDIGNDNCKELASWHHEKLRMEYYGSGLYNYTGTGATSIASFVANNLLEDRACRMLSSTNDTSWDASIIKKFFNERLYQALPTAWKSLIREVTIDATPNSSAAETVYSNGYLYIPNRSEVNGGISFMENNIMRTKFNRYIIPETATYYNTSTDPQTDSDITNIKIGDIWTIGEYSYMLVSADDINKYGLTVKSGTTISSIGGWIAGEKYWTRTPEYSGSSYFTIVNNDGKVSSSTYSAYLKLCVCFSL